MFVLLVRLVRGVVATVERPWLEMIASFRVLEHDHLLLGLPVCGPKWGRRRFPSPLGVVTASSILVVDGVLVLQRHLRSSRL